MYATCLTCHRHLGRNEDVEGLPVGRRLAFDAARGRLWVVCPRCGGWNLTPLEERWEAIEQCERRFRGTPLRMSSGHVGMAQLASGLELVRIGPALRPEIAAWRYGRRLAGAPGGDGAARRAAEAAARWSGDVLARAAAALPRLRRGRHAALRLRLRALGGRVVDVVPHPGGERAVVRYRDLERAELLRPDRGVPWRLVVPQARGPLVLSGREGLRSAGRLLSAVNGRFAPAEAVRGAVRRLEDAGDPDGYFARVTALALRTAWGRTPDAPRDLPVLAGEAGATERLALYLTGRSFWGRGGIGSEPRTALVHLPLVDRLALEMAAHEDTERRALEGELAELAAAWREAEEVAAIADALPARAHRAAPRARGWWPAAAEPAPGGV